jgi:hypothetical protein
VILRSRQRQDVPAVRHHDETGFLALQELLDHDAMAGFAEGVPRQHVQHGGFGFGGGPRHDHALARRQSVRLDDDRRTLLADEVDGRGDLAELAITGRGDAVAGHEILGEGLRPFQLRGSGPRPEALQAGLGETVDDAVHQWILRPGNGQLDALLAGEADQAVEIIGGQGDVLAAALHGGAGISRRDEHLLDLRGLCRRPRQGVLAAAASYDQYLHFNFLSYLL